MVDGASQSFEQWYRDEHPRLLTAIVVVTGDTDVAREAVDEAFARALERWERVKTFEFPTAWTYRVALNVARRHWRRRALEIRVLRQVPAPLDVPPPTGELWLMVSALARRQREVVVLRYVADLTEEDIAGVLKISRGNVARTLFDAHARLSDLLDATPDNSTLEVPNVSP
jgi:RNA polymerase sigma-70 factor (ECF subfamily)